MPSHVGIGRATWSSGTSVVVPIPAGAAAGDGIEVFAFCEGSTRTSSNAQGLTKIGQVVGTSSFVIATYWKILVAADITRGTFTIAHSGGGSPAFAGGKSRAITAVANETPLVALESAYDSSSTSHSATDEVGQLTTTRPGAFLSVIAMDANGTMTFSPPASWTEDEDQAGNAFFHLAQASAGATGAITFTTAAAGQVLCCTFAWPALNIGTGHLASQCLEPRRLVR